MIVLLTSNGSNHDQEPTLNLSLSRSVQTCKKKVQLPMFRIFLIKLACSKVKHGYSWILHSISSFLTPNMQKMINFCSWVVISIIVYNRTSTRGLRDSFLSNKHISKTLTMPKPIFGLCLVIWVAATNRVSPSLWFKENGYFLVFLKNFHSLSFGPRFWNLNTPLNSIRSVEYDFWHIIDVWAAFIEFNRRTSIWLFLKHLAFW